MNSLFESFKQCCKHLCWRDPAKGSPNHLVVMPLLKFLLNNNNKTDDYGMKEPRQIHQLPKASLIW